MSNRAIVSLALAVLGLTVASAAATGTPLTFAQRVQAQEAMERVFFRRHLASKEGAAPRPVFEEAVPKARIEAKVADDIMKSEALVRFWQRPIQPEELQAERDRLLQGTGEAALLRELFSALHDDPTLISECLVRPILADRLLRDLYARDAKLHEGAKESAERAARKLTPQNFVSSSLGLYSRVRYERGTEAAPPSPGPAKAGAGPEVVRLPAEEWQRLEKALPAPGELSPVQESESAFGVTHTLEKGEGVLDIEWRSFPKKSFGQWWVAEKPSLWASMRRADSALKRLTNRLGYLIDGKPYGPRPDTSDWTDTDALIWGGGRYMDEGGRYNPSYQAQRVYYH